jgi:hypothetical protein
MDANPESRLNDNPRRKNGLARRIRRRSPVNVRREALAGCSLLQSHAVQR